MMSRCRQIKGRIERKCSFARIAERYLLHVDYVLVQQELREPG